MPSAGDLFLRDGVLALSTRGVERQARIERQLYQRHGLKARFDVLKERQDLKYAALDCWKSRRGPNAHNITLQRFSFADGQKLSLSGTARDQVNTVFDFNTTMQKATNQNLPCLIFQGGEPVIPHKRNKATWSFILQWQHTEKLP